MRLVDGAIPRAWRLYRLCVSDTVGLDCRGGGGMWICTWCQETKPVELRAGEGISDRIIYPWYVFQKYGIIMFCCREKRRSHQVHECRISSRSRPPDINHRVVVAVDEDSPAAPLGPPSSGPQQHSKELLPLDVSR